MLQVILEILMIVLIILLNVVVIIFYREVNKEFTNIYCRVFELEKQLDKKVE